MQNYREIYDRLRKSLRGGWPGGRTHPSLTDDLLREQGIEVLGSDQVIVSTSALLVHYAERIKELEERVKKLENR